MSWLPQRWRTQRNAIRHANCTIQWVIKTLNATCTSFGEYVCSSVCSSPPKKHPPRCSFGVDRLIPLVWGWMRPDGMNV